MWLSSAFCEGGEDFCSSPVCWQVCSPVSEVWRSSLRIGSERPQHAALCPAHFFFLHRLFLHPHGPVPPKPLLLWNLWLLARHQEGAQQQKWGKLSLVLGKACFWLFLPWQDVATWTASAMWQRVKWGRRRGHGLWASPQVPQALSPSSLPSGLSGGCLSVLPDPDPSHDQQHPFVSR